MLLQKFKLFGMEEVFKSKMVELILDQDFFTVIIVFQTVMGVTKTCRRMILIVNIQCLKVLKVPKSITTDFKQCYKDVFFLLDIILAEMPTITPA